METVSVCVAAGQENVLLNSETNPLDSSECLYDKKSGSMLKYTIATTSIRCERSDTSALIDSCASASLISKRFLEKVLSESQRPIQIKQIQQRLAVNGVGGHDSNPNTYCVLHISLGNRTIQHPFIVHENLPHNLLLGLDFIVPNGGIIDTTNSELRLTKLKITVSITMAQKTSEIRKAEILFAAESVTIELFSSAVITARAMKNSKIKRGTIKGNIHTYDKIAAKKGIFTAKGSPTLVNGETLILLGNLSKEPIKVSPGTYVSVFAPQEGEETEILVSELFGDTFSFDKEPSTTGPIPMDLGDKHPDLPTSTIKDSPTESQGETMDLSQFIKDKLTQEELTTIQAKVKELGFDLSKTNLSEKEHLELQQLIFHFRDRFEIDPKKTEVTDLVKFGIAIRDDKIVNTPINRAP